ncbi:fatty acid desaturase family protein [Paenibacillus ihumii]|uniref:fatty acid desaturase family protein n=1 Tax=Paenibacillus ihumii TaxID=687436 RepID=UPI0006D778F0|nr:fatty acid desaturase family protein [Paenibacillus ihumii]
MTTIVELQPEKQKRTANPKTMFSKDILNEIRALQAKNNWYNFFSIALDWTLIALAIAVSQYFQNIYAYAFAVILIGGRMRGLDNLMHEASHGMLFKNRWLNKWVTSMLVSFPVFTNYMDYCQSHYKHHKYLWTDQDPDTSQLTAMGLNKATVSKLHFFFKHIIGFFIVLNVPKNIWNVLTKLFSRKLQTTTDYVVKLGYWAAVITLSIYLNFWLELIMYWVVPLVIVFPVIRFWSDLADHSGLESSDPLYSSRNSYGNVLERLILYPHHDTYHIVHHLFPAIPHYNLKKAHLILMRDEAYARAHHCTGFFKSFFPGFYSVIDDVVRKLNQKDKERIGGANNDGTYRDL